MGAIETIGLTKQHGDVTVVGDFNLVVEEITAFGISGPNGARENIQQ